MPRTTVGRQRVGGIGEGPSTALGVDGPSRGLGGPWRAGARPRNKAGAAGGCKPCTDAGVGAARLGGVRLARESVLFMARRGDSLEAIFRMAATAARDPVSRSLRRALQLAHSPVSFAGSLTLRNSTSGRSCLQVRQFRTAKLTSSSVWPYIRYIHLLPHRLLNIAKEGSKTLSRAGDLSCPIVHEIDVVSGLDKERMQAICGPRNC